MDDWRTSIFRECVISSLADAMSRAGNYSQTHCLQMENHYFQKSATKAEYLMTMRGLIRGFCKMSQGTGTNQAAEGVLDLVNGLQTLALQGGPNPSGAMGGPQDVPDLSAGEDSWRTQPFRQRVASKIEEAIQQSGITTTQNSIELENNFFQKAKDYAEYLGYVARLILHLRQTNRTKEVIANQGASGAPNPINSLQILAMQGSQNPVMTMEGANGVDFQTFCNMQSGPNVSTVGPNCSDGWTNT